MFYTPSAPHKHSIQRKGGNLYNVGTIEKGFVYKFYCQSKARFTNYSFML